jgi:hypothetical protein
VRCFAFGSGGIELAKLAGEDPDRPAVDDDVVEAQDQDVVVLGLASSTA